MKLVLPILAFLFLIYLSICPASAQNSLAERKADVKYPAKSKQSGSYYTEQTELWRQETRLNPFNTNAWFRLYTAQRHALFYAEKRITPEGQLTLDQITAEIIKKAPGSFESELVIYINGNNDMKLFFHLEKAYELSPASIETYPEFVAYYELTGDKKKKQEFCKKLYSSKYFHNNIMTYNYNVLMSLEQNAILFTNGDYDTYPLWLLQVAEGVRKDVTVINTSLLENIAYLKRIFSETGIAAPEHAELSNRAVYVNEMVAVNAEKPLYFSLTLSKGYTSLIIDRLYVTGLAFRYSSTPFENLPILKENLERRFRTIPETEEFKIGDLSKYIASTGLDANYIVPMLLLHDYYNENREKQKAEELMKSVLLLAAKSGQQAIVTTYLDSKK